MGFLSNLFAAGKSHQSYEHKHTKKTLELGRQNVVGVGHKNLDGTIRQTIIKKCLRVVEGYDTNGHMLCCFAGREPDNKHDPNAFRVYAEEHWETRNYETREKYLGTLGYLSRDVSAQIAIVTSSASDKVYIFLGDPHFEEFQDKSGKTLIGVSFTVRVSWECSNSI
jgi:hypothetical protein